MNQMTLVLKHLRKHKYLSSFQAYDLYGITRLSAVIYNLRDAGYKIDTVWRKATNRYGNLVQYVDYFLIKEGK